MVPSRQKQITILPLGTKGQTGTTEVLRETTVYGRKRPQTSNRRRKRRQRSSARVMSDVIDSEMDWSKTWPTAMVLKLGISWPLTTPTRTRQRMGRRHSRHDWAPGHAPSGYFGTAQASRANGVALRGRAERRGLLVSTSSLVPSLMRPRSCRPTGT